MYTLHHAPYQNLRLIKSCLSLCFFTLPCKWRERKHNQNNYITFNSLSSQFSLIFTIFSPGTLKRLPKSFYILSSIFLYY
ncbi:hypothetical protein KSS87_002859 [Heliosperma pusillum]|nr:hypothetical protein KSS87_002859 [Heliosperma pusillum]